MSHCQRWEGLGRDGWGQPPFQRTQLQDGGWQLLSSHVTESQHPDVDFRREWQRCGTHLQVLGHQTGTRQVALWG